MNIHVQPWLSVWGRGVRRTPGGGVRRTPGGEGCQEDTRGGGMEAIIKLIYVVEDYANLMSHSS